MTLPTDADVAGRGRFTAAERWRGPFPLRVIEGPR